eukprot:Protomagalhaensia_wolfi_Nauph_80__4518@NODE_4639_length_533_cov_3_989879_g3727_i0_p1_GENE_NODE_4639_length_533_cov_3_989879_g3727_i0NODE_4639_length_533_cov_3_989879_g3727_i0_p1_ORF_typecomplete_len124_score10_86DUF2138/PF09909_9/0_035_NODE_4639_length_533_cov_3_989879_g3727_i079450
MPRNTSLFSLDSSSLPPTVMVAPHCSNCHCLLYDFAVNTARGAVLCAACWWIDDSLTGTPLLLTDGIADTPSGAASHLLAHQQNMVERVIGTRTATLPDHRQAVMTTQVHEYKLDRNSGSLVR